MRGWSSACVSEEQLSCYMVYKILLSSRYLSDMTATQGYRMSVADEVQDEEVRRRRILPIAVVGTSDLPIPFGV